MRFGQTLHQFLVPEWASFYVPYDALKNSFNAAVATSLSGDVRPDFSELYALLKESVNSSNQFHSNMRDFLTLSQELCLGRAQDSRRRRECGASTDCETANHLNAISELGADLDKLRWYDQVVDEALRRIYAKIERIGGYNQELHRQHKSRWLESKASRDLFTARYSEGLNALTAGINSDVSNTETYLFFPIVCAEREPCVHPLLANDSALISALRHDDHLTFSDLLTASLAMEKQDSGIRSILFRFAELAVIYHAKSSFEHLLSELFARYKVAADHCFLGRILTVIGRKQHVVKRDGSITARSLDSHDSNDCDSLCIFAINQLQLDQREALLRKDVLGRLPLHYGSLYGLTAVCESITISLRAWESGCHEEAISFPDSIGLTPLHYAVIHNHIAVARILLNSCASRSASEMGTRTDELANLLSDLLVIAIRYQFDEMVSTLQSFRSHIGHYSIPGESALYVAAQIGRDDYVKTLLEDGGVTDMDITEPLHGWSPLFIASVKGHLSIVKLLLSAGANPELLDSFGWTAKEHAASRGHLALAGMPNLRCPADDSALLPTKPPSTLETAAPIDKVHAIVTLGVPQGNRKVQAVNLQSSLRKGKTYSTDISLMEISISDESSPSHLVQLPILGDMAHEPFIFQSAQSYCYLKFKLFRADSTCEGGHRLAGSALVALKGDEEYCGVNRESLVRTRTIHIVEVGTSDILGTVTFAFVLAKPLAHSLPYSHLCCRGLDGSLQLIGHRGLGQNTADHTYLQLGENTIQSFRSAITQGASCVECDVQLTKDLVPVIYHDFSFSESGTDIPLHDLSYEQFVFANKLRSSSAGFSSMTEEVGERIMLAGARRARVRSRSMTYEHEHVVGEIRDRLKLTVDFQNKGFKSNAPGDFVHDSFLSLEELIVRLPESDSLNLEIKYPRLHEAAEAGIAPLGIEINTFVDTILDTVFRFSKERTIILSSFTPEICILLSMKQKTYPVMFITNAGRPPMADKDIRASSLRSAVFFAKRWRLNGIVFASETLVLCPRLVGYVRRSGLICGSYGPLNNIPAHAKAQVAAGLQLLMADRVGMISRALK